jgi:hypothetical protein
MWVTKEILPTRKIHSMTSFRDILWILQKKTDLLSFKQDLNVFANPITSFDDYLGRFNFPKILQNLEVGH